MSRTEQVILTNMCMITDGQQVLVQDRNSKKWPGVTFPGGGIVS
ncbi:TPA: DNA mismatch repair protein MutT [Streptococcus suis]|nr:DNA mismatch repair protein MutT [Streptococcus suis]HEM3904779.1 DNA mismatch repair protein MutT [Streptococcus suis]HEM4064852.1 DNA mismatch repair protein MutT [Streptococcus suis]